MDHDNVQIQSSSLSLPTPSNLYSFYKLIFVEINYPTKQYSKEYPINEKRNGFKIVVTEW